MNKLLNIIQIILLIILFLLNVYFIFSRAIHAVVNDWGGYPIYLIFLVIIMLITIKDILKKSNIHQNNTYHIISILVFLIMNVIFFRVLFDSHLIFNNEKIVSIYNKFGGFPEYPKYYLKQNMIYFNVMFILLFVYRRINLNIKNN